MLLNAPVSTEANSYGTLCLWRCAVYQETVSLSSNRNFVDCLLNMTNYFNFVIFNFKVILNAGYLEDRGYTEGLPWIKNISIYLSIDL